MRILELKAIRAAIDPPVLVDAVRRGFVDHAAGRVDLPAPVSLLFRDAAGALAGDCHVKAARAEGVDVFVVKVATGFYGNAARGLPPFDGLMLLISAVDGRPVALLRDEGWLTAARTAAAGVLAAGLRAHAADDVLGIVGTGSQALLQARWITRALGLSRVRIWGRSRARAEALARTLATTGLEAAAVASVAELCAVAATVVTTTPATVPLVRDADVPQTLHLVAVGSDSPGKQELDPAILGRASAIVVDDLDQCADHGELAAAIAAGAATREDATPLGRVLPGARSEHREADGSAPILDAVAGGGVSVVDLTGLGIQDLMAARVLWSALGDDA